MNNIREHLCRVASEVSEKAFDCLPPAAGWAALRERIRAQYLEMMGLADCLAVPPADRPPLNVQVAGALERPGYRVERVLYESLPRLYVTANLYVPGKLDGPAPAVLYVCGHAPEQKLKFQNHARRWCQLGFVCLVHDTIQFGEIRGYHHGTYRWDWFNWQSRGYTPAAVECLNGVRGIDLLAARPEVDAARIGVTGISGGGGASWWVGAADERARAVAPVCGTGTVAHHLRDKTYDEHCDCMFYPNFHRLDLHHLGALIAPRPLMVVSAAKDGIYAIDSVRDVCRRLAPAYEALGVADRLQLVETPGGHGYHEIGRTRIFSFFLEHLAGRRVPPETVGDCDEYGVNDEADSDLIVLPAGPPPFERTTSVQDWFVPKAAPPQVRDADDLKAKRQAIVDRLRATTFAHFPADPPPLALEHLYDSQQKNHQVRHFRFDAEADWRLWLTVGVPEGHSGRGPVAVSIRSMGEGRHGYQGMGAESRLGANRNKRLHAVLEPRGTGDTAWGDGLNWHLRRHAALTGRSVASMQVFDVLRGLAAIRSLDCVDPNAVTLVADGEMTPVAIMAALLDGRLRRLVLDHAVATFDAPSPDARSHAIEMLGVLKVVDLPAAAGLLWPAELVFVHSRPSAYAWAEELYARLGPPGAVVRAKESGDWAERDGSLDIRR